LMVDTVECECITPMLRQATFVEAAEVLDKNLDVVRLARRAALVMLFSDALKNRTLMDQLASGMELVRDDLHRHGADVLPEGVGAALDDALSTFERVSRAVFELLRQRGPSATFPSSNPEEVEALATRIEVLLIVAMTCLRAAAPAPLWLPDLVRSLRDQAHEHARLINRALYEAGRSWRNEPPLEATLLPSEREDAVTVLLTAFEVPDAPSVRAFLLERPEVFELLHESLPALERAFGDAGRFLTLVQGDDWDDRHLTVRVVVPDLTELVKQRDVFEAMWWDEHAHRSRGGLVITVRPS
jgi:hypothetical protein